MEQLGFESPFARFAAEALGQDGFVLVDVGAAGGVAPAWRCFGEKLQGFGFDPDAQEIERLNSIEPARGFHYVAGFVGIPSDHPFAANRRGQPRIARNPWYRLAVARWFHIRRAREQGLPLPAYVRIQEPFGAYDGENAGESPDVIDLPEFLLAQGVATVDFLKIDVDGTDFDILQSMTGWFEKFGILGVGSEVNFFGSSLDTSNTFHNIDRFLKGQNFELLDLSLRRYPTQDLPVPSRVGHPYPACSEFGQLFQGDAYFARDICASGEARFAASLGAERLLKSAALFSLFGLPDCAAEVLVTFHDRLAPLLDIDCGLDLLARQAQPGSANPLPYREYLARFENDAYDGRAPEPVPSALPPGLGGKIRPLAPSAYDPARRIVFSGAACSGTITLHIRTAPGRWHHAVEFPLVAEGLDPGKRLRIDVKAIVRRGCVGVGVLTADGRTLPEEIFVDQSKEPCLIELHTERISQTGSLLVRNVAADGIASELELEIVAVTVLDCFD